MYFEIDKTKNGPHPKARAVVFCQNRCLLLTNPEPIEIGIAVWLFGRVEEECVALAHKVVEAVRHWQSVADLVPLLAVERVVEDGLVNAVAANGALVGNAAEVAVGFEIDGADIDRNACNNVLNTAARGPGCTVGVGFGLVVNHHNRFFVAIVLNGYKAEFPSQQGKSRNIAVLQVRGIETSAARAFRAYGALCEHIAALSKECVGAVGAEADKAFALGH